MVQSVGLFFVFFFFQAEDGIRDWSVTGVQTCALPISSAFHRSSQETTRSESAVSTTRAGWEAVGGRL